ncbi:armadillo-like helical domain containing protein 1 isoform X1 [Denticeps clupeoides]|uniref:armadillo-like helical domain containing protein 1 isoform X1 n=2 Tax=Denticeps clupeoides TaxID=299321 RepID=UPI0010A52ACC|nr:armadillo-like helical domain containing protein 1 isoform X1 [Denticeps clupeoides]
MLPAGAQQAVVGELRLFLQDWDEAGQAARSRILASFVSHSSGKGVPDLELQFGQAASLFLTRITAWTRLTYMFGRCLHLQLKALGVFFYAPNNHSYLTEFLEAGGIMTLLEILAWKPTKEENKVEALHLLNSLSNAGRRYKEFICESYGVGIVAECFALSKKVETQKTARALLESLAHGNPKFQIQVYKALIGLLSCTSPNGQCLVLQTLHGIQATIKPADQSVVEPLLNLLRSLHPQVQIEAFELISELKHYEVRPALLKSLVELLKSPKQDVQRHKILQGPEMSKMTEPLPVFVQQAAAAKVIRNLAQSGEEISNELLTLGVVHHLLYAMGKQGHADTQRQASLALEYFVRTYPKVEEHAHRCMGAALFESFMCNPEDIYMKIDASQAEILQSNDVNISDVEKVSFINNE